jgi:protein-S-isoprenylcysteine O-methyltransferase Ste14
MLIKYLFLIIFASIYCLNYYFVKNTKYEFINNDYSIHNHKTRKAFKYLKYWFYVQVFFYVFNILDHFVLYESVFVSAVGITLAFFAQQIYIWALHYRSLYFDTKNKGSKENRIIYEGPFRYVRHPLYLSAIMLSVSLFICSGNILFLLHTFATIYVLKDRIAFEERALLSTNSGYKAYCQHTPNKLLPGVY